MKSSPDHHLETVFHGPKKIRRKNVLNVENRFISKLFIVNISHN